MKLLFESLDSFLETPRELHGNYLANLGLSGNNSRNAWTILTLFVSFPRFFGGLFLLNLHCKNAFHPKEWGFETIRVKLYSNQKIGPPEKTTCFGLEPSMSTSCSKSGQTTEATLEARTGRRNFCWTSGPNEHFWENTCIFHALTVQFHKMNDWYIFTNDWYISTNDWYNSTNDWYMSTNCVKWFLKSNPRNLKRFTVSTHVKNGEIWPIHQFGLRSKK